MHSNATSQNKIMKILKFRSRHLSLDGHIQPKVKSHSTLPYKRKTGKFVSQAGSFNYLNRHSIHFYQQDIAESLT
jgi:hypothetical protein